MQGTGARPRRFGGELPVMVLPVAAPAVSGRTTFEAVLLAALGLAMLGVLLAVVMAIVETRRRDRLFEAEREHRGDRVSQARRLEEQERRADEVMAQVSTLVEFFAHQLPATDLDLDRQLRVEEPVPATAYGARGGPDAAGEDRADLPGGQHLSLRGADEGN